MGAGRGPRLVGIVAAAAGLVACSGSSSAPTARGPVETLVPSPTTSTSPPAPSSPATQSPDSDIPADHRDIGYIVKVDRVSGTAYIRFDRILFLTGDAANKAAADHGDETPVPNDYYIVNDNPLIRTFEIEPDAVVVKSIAMGCPPPDYCNGGNRGTIADLEAFLHDHPDFKPPFHLHFDAAGKIDRIREQYLP